MKSPESTLRRGTFRSSHEPASQKETNSGRSTIVPSTLNPSLPVWELLLCAVVVLTVYSYATLQLYKASQDFQRMTINGRGLLKRGWKIMGHRYQDTMPGEWFHWKFFTLHPTPLAVFAGHMSGGFIMSKFLPKWRRSFLFCSSVLGALILVSPLVFSLLLLHAMVAYLVAIVGRRVWLLWLVVLSQLAATVISPLSSWQLSLIPEVREYRVKFIIAMAFCCLRFLAFGLGYIRRHQRMEKAKEQTESEEGDLESMWTVWDYFLYVFYLPTVAHGPFMPPEGFFRQIKQAYYPSSWTEVRWVCLQWLRPLLCAVFLEWVHHYLYTSALLIFPNQLEKVPIIALIALAEWCTIIFQVQYMVYYGFARAMAIFDGVLTPALPTCMQCILQAKDGWRYFDKGEYLFILKNIYIPLGGSQLGTFRQYFALVASYCFTCFWHGFHYHIMGMVVTFWVLVQWEAFSPLLAKSIGITRLVIKLSPLMRRRLDCVLTAMKYPVLVWGMVMFITTIDVGKIYVQRVFGEDASWVLPGLVAVHYCHVQLVEECCHRWGRKHVLEKHYMGPPKV